MIESIEPGVDCNSGGAAREVAPVDRAAAWVRVQLLTMAADLLPLGWECPPVDVHGCLSAAAVIAGLGDGAAETHRLADAAETLLTDYLVRSGHASVDAPGGTLRGCLGGRSPSWVARELRGAAEFNGLYVLADELDCDGLAAVLSAKAQGSGPVGAMAGAAWYAGRTLC
jgi:hypothetical protein